MSVKAELPDINDMFVAGLPLRDALRLLADIDAAPEKGAAYWWQILKAWRREPQSVQ